MAKTITKERQEQLANRLVLNFGILLGVALIMLYVNNALRSYGVYQATTYTISLILGIIGAAGAVVFFVLGKKKCPKLKNYSAVFLGLFVICALIYLAKLAIIPGYDHIMAVIAVYVAMVVYFIVLAIVTGIMMKRPLEKTAKEEKKHAKKKKRK